MLKSRVSTYLFSLIILAGNFGTLKAQNLNYLNPVENLELELSEQVDERQIIDNLIRLMDYDQYNKSYQAMLRGLDRLAQAYAPDSLSIVARQMELFENHHPFLQLLQNKQAGKRGYDEWSPYTSPQFRAYFSEQVKLFSRYQRLSPDNALVAGKLYKNSTDYLKHRARDEAKYFLEWIKRDYPDSYYVTHNFVDYRLKNIELEEGTVFPEIILSADTDETLIISNEKYTLLIYLDVFSNAFKAEFDFALNAGKNEDNLTKIILLSSEMVPGDMAPIPTDNETKSVIMIADESIKKNLGFSDYSTTYLISPERIIVAKDVPFNDLEKQIALHVENKTVVKK